jgi:DNA polymerase-3 subunit delta
LFGDRRYLWVRASGDEAHDALEVLVGGERLWPVIVQAPGATDKGKCAKLLEKRDDAVVAMFYPPDLRSVTASVRGMASAAGLRMANDLAERIAAASGLDTRLAQSEVTKLALYLDASPERPRDADMAAFAAIGAATEDDGLNPVVNAVLGGDVARLGPELKRMAEVGLNAVGVLLAIERRAAIGGACGAYGAARRRAFLHRSGKIRPPRVLEGCRRSDPPALALAGPRTGTSGRQTVDSPSTIINKQSASRPFAGARTG